MNRSSAKRETFKPNAPLTAIISITDVDKNLNLFQYPGWLRFVYRFQFDDVDMGQKDCITPAQANQIAEAVETIKDKVDRIIVHCEAGISRSSGVAAAIMKYLTGDDMEIFGNGRYTPNMTCYRMVLEALHEPFNEKEIREKQRLNIAFWKKLFDEGRI